MPVRSRPSQVEYALTAYELPWATWWIQRPHVLESPRYPWRLSGHDRIECIGLKVRWRDEEGGGRAWVRDSVARAQSARLYVRPGRLFR